MITVILLCLLSQFKCIIVDVEYRLCPETKALSAFDDCKVVTEWVMQNKSNIGKSNIGANSNQIFSQVNG